MLILSLREQSSQNHSQYDQQHQHNAYPGVATASSRESRRKVLRFNKVNILSCLFLAPPAMRGRDGDIFPASHFSWPPKQDGLVGDSSEDTSVGLEMQRCTTHPETLSTPRQHEPSAEQRRQNEAESETSAPNTFPHKEMTAKGLKPTLRLVCGALEFHPSRRTVQLQQNTEETKVNQVTED